MTNKRPARFALPTVRRPVGASPPQRDALAAEAEVLDDVCGPGLPSDIGALTVPDRKLPVDEVCYNYSPRDDAAHGGDSVNISVAVPVTVAQMLHEVVAMAESPWKRLGDLTRCLVMNALYIPAHFHRHRERYTLYWARQQEMLRDLEREDQFENELIQLMGFLRTRATSGRENAVRSVVAKFRAEIDTFPDPEFRRWMYGSFHSRVESDPVVARILAKGRGKDYGAGGRDGSNEEDAD